MFAPITLQRLDDMSFKYGGDQTMNIGDLFTWLQAAVYGDVSHPKGGDIPLIRRNLQHNYARSYPNWRIPRRPVRRPTRLRWRDTSWGRCISRSGLPSTRAGSTCSRARISSRSTLTSGAR